MLRILLQDLNPSLYNIPYIPTPIVDMIADYASPTGESVPLQAVVCKLPHDYSCMNVKWRAEFHSEQNLRAQFLRLEPEYRAAFACVYCELQGEEFEQFREQYGVKPIPTNLDPLRIENPELYGLDPKSEVERVAANRMLDLVFTLTQTDPKAWTPMQHSIWQQLEKWRNYLVKVMQFRTQQLTSPLGQLMHSNLARKTDFGSDSLFSVTEVVPTSGEFVSTSFMQSNVNDETDYWVIPPDHFSDGFWHAGNRDFRSCEHSSRILPKLSNSDYTRLGSSIPPPF